MLIGIRRDDNNNVPPQILDMMIFIKTARDSLPCGHFAPEP